MQPALFESITVRDLAMANRIMVSPMCQYSAVDGSMNSWHLLHLGSLALSGAGLLVFEATAVSPEGRITPGDSGLYCDDNENAMRAVVAHLRQAGPVPLGIQIGHAGRKGSQRQPWKGGAVPREDGGWQTVAPSPNPFGRYPAPRALRIDEIDELTAAFVRTARRAVRLSLDYLEVHAAHGYLLSEFLSPLANQREDEFGGSLENRMRFPLQVIAAVRNVWPENRPLAVRVNGSDFVDGGWTIDDACAFACAARECGIDMITLSGGGTDAAQKIDARPGYQVEFARRVKAASGLITTAVGMILTPRQADEVITSGAADIVALARGLLLDPRWPYHAAHVLGAEIAYPPQYLRSAPDAWTGADALLEGLAPHRDRS